MEHAHEETYRGIKFKIEYDQDGESPREWDNLGTILYCSREYVLGDKQATREEIDEIAARKDVEFLPVYAYIHGGVTISTGGFSCPWDSGQCGIIYITHEKIKSEYGNTDPDTIKHVLTYLDGEIKTLDQFFTGDVYGYVIEDENLDDSCWGFYGLKSAIEEAKSIIDHATNTGTTDAKGQYLMECAK